MKRIFTYIFIVLAGIVCLQNNKAYAQDGGDDKTKSIILNKYLTPTEDPSKFKITLSSFVHSDEQPVKQTVDIALVLDYSSSMCATDGRYSEVATGDNIDKILCPDFNWSKNKDKYMGSDAPTHNPFFDQKRKVKIGSVEYDLMQYTQDKSNANKNRIGDGHGTDGLPNTHDNKWYIWNGTKWISYNPGSTDIIYSQHRIDVLRSAAVKFAQTLAQISTDWLTINLAVTKFAWEPATYDMANAKEKESEIIEYILNKGTFTDHATSAKNCIIATGTDYDKATTKALAQFKSSSDENHRHIIVLFSDGCPYGENSSRDAIGNNAINNVYNFKHKTNSFIYCIGLLNGAADGWSQLKMENLLRAISSDYPDQKKQLDEKQPQKEDKYYSLANAETLAKIFEDIAHSAAADMYPLNDNNSSAVDIMSNSFSLPEGFTAANVSVHTETCIGIADDYDPANLSDKSFKWTTDLVNGQYYEDSDHQPRIAVDAATQKIVVTNYNYSLKDNTAPATNVKGNWVGGRLQLDSKRNPITDEKGNYKYIYAGKRLVVEFVVDYNGEPGFNIPSNDTKCGIYPNTTGTGEPIKEYNRPMADFPAIIIVKEGLKAGESSIFKVSKGTVYICSLILTGTGETYKAGDMAVNKGFYNAGDAVPAIGIVRDLDYGDYTVEELPWSWAYNMTSYHTGGTTVTQTLKKEGIPTEAEAVAAWTAATTSGKFTGTAYYVINDGITLAYRFKNTPKTSQPLHGESDALNEMPVGDEGGTGDEGEI